LVFANLDFVNNVQNYLIRKKKKAKEETQQTYKERTPFSFR